MLKPTTPRLAVYVLALASVMLTSACNLVYKQDIQQGNVLDREKVEQLETGMTKRQVQVLLGTPSVNSPFHGDRWDYMNTYARRGGEPEKRVLTLRFENGALASMSGNYLDQEDVASDVLDELQDPEEAPIQDLESLREEAEQGGPAS